MITMISRAMIPATTPPIKPPLVPLWLEPEPVSPEDSDGEGEVEVGLEPLAADVGLPGIVYLCTP